MIRHIDLRVAASERDRLPDVGRLVRVDALAARLEVHQPRDEQHVVADLLGVEAEARAAGVKPVFRVAGQQLGRRGRVLAESTPLPEKTLYPKEKELLRICTEAKRDGRKTVVYCVHTETRDITERLKKILGDAGLEAVVLKAAKVKAGEREEWRQLLMRA